LLKLKSLIVFQLYPDKSVLPTTHSKKKTTIEVALLSGSWNLLWDVRDSNRFSDHLILLVLPEGN